MATMSYPSDLSAAISGINKIMKMKAKSAFEHMAQVMKCKPWPTLKTQVHVGNKFVATLHGTYEATKIKAVQAVSFPEQCEEPDLMVAVWNAYYEAHEGIALMLEGEDRAFAPNNPPTIKVSVEIEGLAWPKEVDPALEKKPEPPPFNITINGKNYGLTQSTASTFTMIPSSWT